MLLLVLLALFFLFVLPRDVFAYIDPGSGSYLTQIILGFVFGGLFMVKLYWNKIKNVFFRSRSKNKKGENSKEE
jgi:hypothetical protein